MNNGYYIEVVAPDGLAHHIGPFPRRSNAQAWIRQHADGGAVLQDVKGDAMEKRTAQTQSEERLI
jgi:hypothetical protein